MRSAGCFLGESAVTGLVGSTVGVLVGLLLARGIAVTIGQLMTDVYGVAQQASDVVVKPVAPRQVPARRPAD